VLKRISRGSPETVTGSAVGVGVKVGGGVNVGVKVGLGIRVGVTVGVGVDVSVHVGVGAAVAVTSIWTTSWTTCGSCRLHAPRSTRNATMVKGLRKGNLLISKYTI
jgi:hypothetical protein